ncbi:MAG: hypothetical protein JXL81_12685 [Deltaproteobacteria bacterium]|nr:hypothetical protein [Deltaproteobacteria bacterium]
MAELKYKDCIRKLPFYMDGKLTAVGAKELNGFNCHIIYAFAYETGLTGLSKRPHVHDYDEAIFFIGSDPKNPGYLGAEVTMAIGPDEDEKYTFSEPTAVVVPRGVPHCPIWTNRLEQPFLVMAVSLTGERND